MCLGWVAAGLVSLFSLLWVKTAIPAVRLRHKRIFLKDVSSEICPDLPLVSVIVPARNEYEKLKEYFETLLTQDYPRFEVIAVNDRSTDQTGPFFEEMKAKYSHLKVVHIEKLTEGWMGKAHALQKGVEASQGQWIIFTDADTKWGDSLLKRAVGYSVVERIGYASMVYEPLKERLGARLFLLAFYGAGLNRRKWWFIDDPRRRENIGVGQFQIFKRENLEKIGGLTAHRLSVPEDVYMGRSFKYHGVRCRIFYGEGIFWCRWQEGLAGYIRGLDKSYFPILNFNYWLLIKTVVTIAAYEMGPTLGVGLGLFLHSKIITLIAGVGFFCTLLLTKLYLRHLKTKWYDIFLLPFGSLFVITAMLKSAFSSSANKGIIWRETFYPKALLQKFTAEQNERLEKVWRSPSHR